MLTRSRRNGQRGGRGAFDPEGALAALAAVGAGVPSPVDAWVRVSVLVVVIVVIAHAWSAKRAS